MSKFDRVTAWVLTLALVLTAINIVIKLISGNVGGAWNEVGWLAGCFFGIAYIRATSKPYSRPE